MGKIALSGFIDVPEHEIDRVKKALVNHIELTQSEVGCLVFEVTQRNDHLTRFDVYEEFVDKAAFEAHQQRVQASDWGAVTVNVKRSYQIEEEV
jgi:quinol monooxygenase YgiN